MKWITTPSSRLLRRPSILGAEFRATCRTNLGGLPLQKFVQTPRLLLILTEWNAGYRQIFLDGRSLPVDPQPSWNGYSSGKWEGDKLVVETNGLRDGIWLDLKGDPLTEAAKLTERFRRPNFGKL
jgi:hypothetical protein